MQARINKLNKSILLMKQDRQIMLKDYWQERGKNEKLSTDNAQVTSFFDTSRAIALTVNPSVQLKMYKEELEAVLNDLQMEMSKLGASNLK